MFSDIRDRFEKHKKKVFKNLTEMNLEMVLLWIWAGFECGVGIRTPYMEEI